MWIFSYGSNSVVQLRSRVKNVNLVAYPAKVQGYERIFCMQSSRWGNTGAASLAKKDNAETLGAAAELTLEEVERLDQFEGGYTKEDMDIIIIVNGNETVVKGVAYIAINPLWIRPPSEQYLNAIHLMLREQWSTYFPVIHIKIHGIFQTNEHQSLVLINEWSHPGTQKLSLPSLCVEVNARLPPESAWVMPQTIVEIEEKLGSIGVHSVAHLALYLRSEDTMNLFNSKLIENGHKSFHMNTLHIFRDLLHITQFEN